jgi:hypothetical protein
MGMMMNYMMVMGSFDQKKFSTKTNVLAGRPVLGDSAKASRGPQSCCVVASALEMEWTIDIDAPSSFGLALPVTSEAKTKPKMPSQSRSRAVFAVYSHVCMYVCTACRWRFFGLPSLQSGAAQRNAGFGAASSTSSCSCSRSRSRRRNRSRVWGSASSSRHNMDGNHTSLPHLCSAPFTPATLRRHPRFI